jgi:hypothetical protein
MPIPCSSSRHSHALARAHAPNVYRFASWLCFGSFDGMKKSIIVHIIIWLVLSTLYCIASEPLVGILPEEVQGVETFLMILAAGLILIFALTLISFIITLVVIKRKGVL